MFTQENILNVLDIENLEKVNIIYHDGNISIDYSPIFLKSTIALDNGKPLMTNDEEYLIKLFFNFIRSEVINVKVLDEVYKKINLKPELKNQIIRLHVLTKLDKRSLINKFISLPYSCIPTNNINSLSFYIDTTNDAKLIADEISKMLKCQIIKKYNTIEFTRLSISIYNKINTSRGIYTAL